MLPFLQYLNSTKKLRRDKDPCTASTKGTAPVSPPARCPAPCRCSCNKDRFMSVDCSSSGLTHLPPLFTEEQNSTVVEIFLPRANQEMAFVIEAEIEGLNLSNNKIQSLKEARLPSRTRFLFLDHNLIQKPPVFPPRVPGVPDEGYAVQQSLDLRLYHPRLQEMAPLEIRPSEF
ncbi:hypothetical protein CDAR_603361 [Caerostris darwini]|uniref:LRRNT domain-containing protein n=1 Tax=Caerostris darwini TaxID=1538125 RepID=A0AAV4SN67_9ARAC|nr:hypothetical protein CDAR_603361 [Caerostris darwini]